MSSLLDNVPFITVDQSVLDKILEEIEQANKKVESINTTNWNSDNAETTTKQLDKVLEEIEQATKQIEKINNTMNPTEEEEQSINSEQPTAPVRKSKKNNNRKRSRPVSDNKRRKRNAPTTVTTPSKPQDDWTNWTVKPISDAPLVCWTDYNAGHQRTVQNPANYGTSLLKIQLFEGGVAKHVSAVYLVPDTDVYKSMHKLLSTLENMWVDRETGVSKVDGIIKSVMPLAAWRYSHQTVKADCVNQDGGARERVPAKRRRQADCATQDGGVGSTVPAKPRRARASV